VQQVDECVVFWERCLLGSLLVLGHIPPDLAVRTTDFSTRGNKIVYNAIHEMGLRGLPVNSVTVTNWLLELDFLKYVDDFENLPTDPRLVDMYASYVRKKR
jgi:replicative DNA helicase